jgi:hypothetical protein
MPGASRIVSSMSSSSRCRLASKEVTFLARSRRIGSSAVRMRRMPMDAIVPMPSARYSSATSIMLALGRSALPDSNHRRLRQARGA